jgi:hypothetical protein
MLGEGGDGEGGEECPTVAAGGGWKPRSTQQKKWLL